MEKETHDLIMRDIASSLRTIASGGASHTDLASIVSKLDTLASKQDAIATKLEAIATKLNPLYTADYVAPDSED